MRSQCFPGLRMRVSDSQNAAWDSLRALTRILKTGVQDSHLAKSRSPTGKSGSPTQKKLESHQSVHTVYLFHFNRKWYIWIFFRLTDLNPLSINGLFLLNKTKYFAIFFHNLNTHFFVWPYQIKRLNCWYLFYSLTRQTDKTDSSPLFCISLCRWKSFFSYKNASR